MSSGTDQHQKKLLGQVGITRSMKDGNAPQITAIDGSLSLARCGGEENETEKVRESWNEKISAETVI